MALIAKYSVNHNGVSFAPGEAVDATGADKTRLLELDAVEEQDNPAADKATKARRGDYSRELAEDRAKDVADATAAALTLANATP